MDVREKVTNGKRLIDADKLLTNVIAISNSEGQDIEIITAADVAPVRHGRWIDKGGYAVCTECDGRSGTQYDGVEPIPLMTQFCPNCGAKMDGGAEAR